MLNISRAFLRDPTTHMAWLENCSQLERGQTVSYGSVAITPW